MPRFRFLTWNVNFDERASPEFSWAFRKRYVFTLLEFLEADVVCLQEVHDTYLADVEAYAATKYEMFAQQYHPAGRNLVTLVAKAFPAEQTHVPICPDIENPRKCILAVRLVALDLTIFNFHAPMAKRFRFAYTRHLARHMATVPTSAHIIIAGDWNTFSDANGPEQLEEFLRTAARHFVELSHYMENGSGKRVFRTFEGFPYDNVPPTQPYHLDHLVASKHVRTVGRVVCHDDYRPMAVDGTAWHPSDHFAILAVLHLGCDPPNLKQVGAGVLGRRT